MPFKGKLPTAVVRRISGAEDVNGWWNSLLMGCFWTLMENCEGQSLCQCENEGSDTQKYSEQPEVLLGAMISVSHCSRGVLLPGSC